MNLSNLIPNLLLLFDDLKSPLDSLSPLKQLPRVGVILVQRLAEVIEFTVEPAAPFIMTREMAQRARRDALNRVGALAQLALVFLGVGRLLISSHPSLDVLHTDCESGLNTLLVGGQFVFCCLSYFIKKLIHFLQGDWIWGLLHGL